MLFRSVIRRERALSGFIGRKERVGGLSSGISNPRAQPPADPNEARAQLITLRRSVLKLTGDVLNDDPRDLQLLPIAGRLKCAHVNHVEALCDAEDVLVWSVAVTPTIEKLSVWELDGKHGWKSLPDIHSRANNPTSRMMRFAQLSTVKAFSPN